MINYEDKHKKDINNQKIINNYLPKLQQLNHKYKIPKVIWQQSESLICLSISAPDIDDYHLDVKPQCLIFM